MKIPRNLVKAIYREAKQARKKDKSLTLCQHKELYARKYGFDSLDHLQKDYTIRALRASFENRRLACLQLKPNDSLNDYYQFDIDEEDQSIGYYSHFMGYDDEGYELRSPSIIKGEILIKHFREDLDKEAYVIEDLESLYQWRFVWSGIAIINAGLVESNVLFKRTLKPTRSHNPLHTRLTKELTKDMPRIDG